LVKEEFNAEILNLPKVLMANTSRTGIGVTTGSNGIIKAPFPLSLVLEAEKQSHGTLEHL
jgi:hypothetical protein